MGYTIQLWGAANIIAFLEAVKPRLNNHENFALL